MLEIEKKTLEALRAEGAVIWPRAVSDALHYLKQGVHPGEVVIAAVWQQVTPGERYAVDAWLNSWDNPLAEATSETPLWRFKKLIAAITSLGIEE